MKKRILLVIPSLHAGGMERVMSELANEFAKDTSLDVQVLLYGKKPEIFYTLHEDVRVHVPPFQFGRSRFISTVKTLAFLRRKISELTPDTILSFGEYWNSFVLLATLGLPYPVYVSDRCQPSKNLGKMHERLRTWLYPKAAGVIAQTGKAKQIFQKVYDQPNTLVIGNPIRQIVTTTTANENIVLTVGRLIASKHHDELIKLFAKINKADWKLVIVGDDALKQQNKKKLEQLVEEIGLSGKIILAGKQKDVDSFYLKSKIFAFTSSSEGFPNVIGEAQSAGLPVVAFDCVAGPAEMINDGKNGFLVPLFDYEMFAEKLALLMENEDLRKRMGEQAQLDIQRFNTAAISAKFREAILR